MSLLERAIMNYLWSSIDARGGIKPGNQARRLSRIWIEMDWQGSLDDYEFSRAIESLRVEGFIRLEEMKDFGFIYAHPLRKLEAGELA